METKDWIVSLIFSFVGLILLRWLYQLIRAKAEVFVLSKHGNGVYRADRSGEAQPLSSKGDVLYYLGVFKKTNDGTCLQEQSETVGKAAFNSHFKGVSHMVWGAVWKEGSVESMQPNYRGYVDAQARIYVKESEYGAATYVGFLARPKKNSDAMPRPSLKGKRYWYELWLVQHLDVYYGAYPDEVVKKEKRKKVEPEMVEDGEVLVRVRALVDALAAKKRKEKRRQRRAGLVGKIKLYGFFSFMPQYTQHEDTLEARAGLVAMMHYLFSSPRSDYSEEMMVSPKTWKDTALFSSLVFSLLFVLFFPVLWNGELNTFMFLGEQWSFVAACFACYGIIWWGVTSYKRYSYETGGRPFNRWLYLLNKSVGLGPTFVLVFILGALALNFSVSLYGFQFVPLVLVILCGVGVNKLVPMHSKKWLVLDKHTLQIGNMGDVNYEEDETEVRKYNWSLESYNTEQDVYGWLSLYFNASKVTEFLPAYRESLFMDYGESARRRCEVLWKEVKNDDEALKYLRSIVSYISRRAMEENLSGIDTLQFTLDFVQELRADTRFDESLSPAFPAEVLWHGGGSSLSLSFLLASLYTLMNVESIVVFSTNGEAAVGVKWGDTWSAGDGEVNGEVARDVKLRFDGEEYYFCETKDKWYKVGDFPNKDGLSTGNFREYIKFTL